MALSKLLACTLCAAVAVSAAGCADGTGKAFTPTLPTVDATTTNPDGTRLKASLPQPAAPRSSVRLKNLTPTLRLANGSATFDSTASFSYVFQVLDGALDGTSVLLETEPIEAGDPETTFTVPEKTLKLNRTYGWRARVTYNGVVGAWSDVVTFRTPLPPPVDGPVYCTGSSGLDIVKCVGAAYPAKTVSTAAGDGSLERRKANMEFVRDRIIETARCKGMDLARNFKRGGPVISHDFIVLRTNRDYGVDIATGYDDVNQPLRLKWQVFGSDENYGYPYYAGYPVPFDCSNLVGQP